MLVVYYEKEGKKRLGVRKKMTQRAKGKKNTKKRREKRKEPEAGRATSCALALVAAPLLTSTWQNSAISKLQHRIRIYFKLFITFMEKEFIFLILILK